jgi:predicted peptidase
VPEEENRSTRDIISLLSAATELAPIDENRIYIIGCDIGGDGVYGALTRYPGLFAGAVTIGGKWSYLDKPKLAKTPLLILQGGADTAVTPAFSSLMAQLVNASGGKAAYHEFPGLGHECDPPSYYSAAVWNWLFSQTKAAKAVAPAAPAPAPAVTQTPAPAPVAVPPAPVGAAVR